MLKDIRNRLQLVIVDKKNKLVAIPGLEPAGMAGGRFFRLRPEDLIKLPHDSEFFVLPDRSAVGYDPVSRRFVKLDEHPAAAFVSPGYTALYSAAYEECRGARLLPLFAYAALACYKGDLYTAAIRVDREKRQQFSCADIEKIKKNVLKLRKLYPDNRLMRHLETCALVYGCPAGKNFFLSRYEAPLPAAQTCNSDCIGCISYQPRGRCPVTQPRIKFTPSPEEIKETALYHIEHVKDPVVSFGQGCEGEPLLAGDAIEKAVRLIRKETQKGMINLNTNASRPGIIGRLFDAGLDSIRVSMNSVREEYYVKYYRPRGYKFRDVLESIRIAKKKKGFVSVNYLVMPGFTDSFGEYRAFMGFLDKYKIDMIQWRNLNFDPRGYFKELGLADNKEMLLSMSALIRMVRKKIPRLMFGYFNPSKQRIKRWLINIKIHKNT